MNYEQSVEYLYHTLEHFGWKLDLARINKLLDALNHPEVNYKIIQVAGTNGKGSTSAMLSSIITEAGYNVGLFTSPHLHDIRERFLINGKMISEQQFAELANKIKSLDVECTFFEFITAMALEYFSGKTEYVVLEVGLGGRFDATTAAPAEISVITTVDFDHMQHLGDTIEKIAFEKAGVIRPGKILVTTVEKSEAFSTIKKVCEDKKCDIIVPPEDTFDLSLNGSYQQRNAACAAQVARLLNITEEDIRTGLRKTVWPGRFELINGILFDCAHNPAAMRSLTAALQSLNYDKLYLVVGFKSTKDVAEIVKAMPVYDKVFVTQSKPPPEPLQAEEVAAYLKNPVVIKDVKEAVKAAKNVTSKNDLICVCGSLFVVSEAREEFI